MLIIDLMNIDTSGIASLEELLKELTSHGTQVMQHYGTLIALPLTRLINVKQQRLLQNVK